MGDLTEHFDSVADNLRCPCCGECNMDSAFMEWLEEFRVALGIPFSAVDGGGYRCPDFNESDTGAHTEGVAIDLDLYRVYYHEALRIAMEMDVQGVGIKQREGRFQLHLDMAEDIPGLRPRPRIWTYG